MVTTNTKVAVVTGGVSGIGQELTRKLIQQGWKVAAFDIASQNHLASKLSEQLGDDFSFLPCDVSVYRELADAFAKVFKRHGQIDAFCSNAGIIDKSSVYIFSHRGKSEVPPPPDLSTTDVCFKALVYGTQLSIHFMRQNPTPGGFIVATASMVAVHPISSLPEYCGAKAAMNAFVQSTAPILKQRENITINSVNPGVVPTQFIDQAMRDTFGQGLTPKSTIVAGYLKFLGDKSLNGELLECSRDQLLILERPEYADGEFSKRTGTVYDPLFVSIHGEPSRQKEALNPQSWVEVIPV